MKFPCLICAEIVMEQMSGADAEKHFEEYREFTEEIRKSGHFVGCNRLKPPHTATTIRILNGRRPPPTDLFAETTDLFAETKEQFGGYYVIEARDLNEAPGRCD